jgi:glucan 1,4-alpha-glucosidase
MRSFNYGAQHEMLVNFHDNPMPPTGERRTWPNMILREYCWAQQDRRSSFEPVTAVTVPFVNYLSGPLDKANGFYDLNNLQNRLAVDKNGLNSTVISETARCLVMWAPLLILPDHGEAYQAKADVFEFIKSMPSKWDETIGLAGYPGEFITVARRKGSDWFVGTVNNEDARELELKMDFLPPGVYDVVIYADTPDTHYITNKESYQNIRQRIKNNEHIRISMAPGGGNCMWIKRLD